jgi:hypothetical protein
MVWLDVIADGRRRNDGALQAKLTERVFAQLVLPDPGPTSRGVPLVPLRLLAANAHHSPAICKRRTTTALVDSPRREPRKVASGDFAYSTGRCASLAQVIAKGPGEDYPGRTPSGVHVISRVWPQPE